MSSILPVVVTIVGIFMFIIIVIVKVITSNMIKKLDIPENAPIVDIGFSRTKFTDGYKKGHIISQIPCKNNCTRITFFPSDYEQGEHKVLPGKKKIIVANEFIKRLARGDGSSYREEVQCIDRFKFDLPEKIANSPEGDNLEEQGAKAFLKRTMGDWTRGGDDAMHEYIIRNTRVGMTKLQIAKMIEEAEVIRKLNQGVQAQKQDEATQKEIYK